VSTGVAAGSEHHRVRGSKSRLGARRTIIPLLGVLAACGGVASSVCTGTADLSVSEAWKAIWGGTHHTARLIVVDLRLARALVGCAVGANLAVAGALLQGVTRNPLAAPGIIGVNAGAGVAAVGAMILFPEYDAAVPVLAFAGGMGAAVLVYSIAWGVGGSRPLTLVLAGVAVSSLLGAAMSGIMVMHSDKVQGVIAWTVGGLSGRSWPYLRMILPYTVTGTVIAFVASPSLNVLSLGDDAARGLGLRVGAARLAFTGLAAALAASAVAVVGLLGFVGLIVPHAARLLVGADHRLLVPTSAAFGAALVVTADLAARTAFGPLELPVGILTAGLGAPFFLYILKRRIAK